MSVIALLEQSIVSRIAAALTLPGQDFPKVEVRAWPERPREYQMRHPCGCVLVLYKGSKFAQDRSPAGQLVDIEAEFELGMISRTLREPSVPEGGTTPPGVGIYELLESCRSVLLGWKPEQATGAVRLRSEGFDDYSEGTWGYSLRLQVPMTTVADLPCPSGPWSSGLCCDEAPLVSRIDIHSHTFD